MTTTPLNLRTIQLRIALLAALFAAASILVAAVSWTLRAEPLHTDTFKFDRDALSSVNIRDHYWDVVSYYSGDGFNVELRTENDPAANYQASSRAIVLAKAEGSFDYPERRSQVDAKCDELRQATAAFVTRAPVPTSIELGVDVTDGLSSTLRERILLLIQDLKKDLDSTTDPVTLLFFRISDTDYRDYRTWSLQPKSKPENVDEVLTSGSQWLLSDQGPKARTSLAMGLFNELKIAKGSHRRRIVIVSDGIDNLNGQKAFIDGVTTTPELLEKTNWAALDKSVSSWEAFPDLRFASVTWYFVPHGFRYYRAVQKYWEHVLRDQCRALNVDVIY